MLYTDLPTIKDEKLRGILEKVIFIEKEIDVDLTADMEYLADHICNLQDKTILSKERVVFLKLIKLYGWGSRNDEDAWNKILQNIAKLLRTRARICNRFDGIFVLEINEIMNLDIPLFIQLAEFLEELQAHCQVVLTYTATTEDKSDLMDTKERLWSQLSICEIQMKHFSSDLYVQMLWEEFPKLKETLSNQIKEELITYIKSYGQKSIGLSQYRYLLNLLYPCHECTEQEYLNTQVKEVLRKCRLGQDKSSRVTIGFAK